MELTIWPGDFGLPSLTSNCIATMVYCKFAGAPVRFQTKWFPLFTPNGDFPVFTDENTKLTNIHEIFAHLRHKGWGIDNILSTKDTADNVAFVAIIEEKLAPVVEHLLWVHDANYSGFTRGVFGSAVGFPLSLYYPARRRAHLTEQADILKVSVDDAMACLTALSQKLGEKEYFFGDSPTTLDAVVFSYLAPILKLPLSHSPLEDFIRNSCQNLSQYCTRILNKYFPLSGEELGAAQRRREQVREDGQKASFISQIPSLLVSALAALGASSLYVYWNGIPVKRLLNTKIFKKKKLAHPDEYE